MASEHECGIGGCNAEALLKSLLNIVKILVTFGNGIIVITPNNEEHKSPFGREHNP